MRILLLLYALPLARVRVPVTPLKRRMLLNVLARLTLDAPDLRGDQLSIDIGSTLAKVVLFQPSPPPEDGQRPRLSLNSPSLDAELDALLGQVLVQNCVWGRGWGSQGASHRSSHVVGLTRGARG